MSATALQKPPDRSRSRRKTVLFCPTCDHAARVDGDWITHATSDHERYECPECSTTVVTQPRF